YSVIRPAELPKSAIKPKVPAVLGLGLIAALIAAAAGAALFDVRSRRLVEPWQIERQLGVMLLGDLPRA
ncbi:MAG TPA: hypothetical protein VK454_07095, partial [Myxococcaceae bacterium]|nr:hypothetical protein [Myxococcaceae bacterium]